MICFTSGMFLAKAVILLSEDLSGLVDPDFEAYFDWEKQSDTYLSARDFAFLQETTIKRLPLESASFNFSPDSIIIWKVVKASRSSTFDNKTLKILRQLREKLNDSLVIDVIKLVKNPELCIKFFTWAGRQISYVHKGSTYNALIEILGFNERIGISHEFLKEIGDDDQEVLHKMLNVLTHQVLP
jgi:hypothetical protein